MSARRLAPGALALALLLPAGACVHVNRGAIVQMNFQTLDSNVAGEHYELFAVFGHDAPDDADDLDDGGGAVSIGRFKVLDAIDNTLSPPADGIPRQHCAGDPLITPNVQLVQLYENDYDAASQCDPGERIGTVDKFSDGLRLILAGGVRLDTDVDLAHADALFLSIEPDGDSDPRPAERVLRAGLARGSDPLTCLFETPPPERRGVLLGSFVPVTDTRECPFRVGRVAVVPAEDETVL